MIGLRLITDLQSNSRFALVVVTNSRSLSSKLMSGIDSRGVQLHLIFLAHRTSSNRALPEVGRWLIIQPDQDPKADIVHPV